VGDFLKGKLLVKPLARWIWKGDSTEHAMEPKSPHFLNQSPVE